MSQLATKARSTQRRTTQARASIVRTSLLITTMKRTSLECVKQVRDPLLVVVICVNASVTAGPPTPLPQSPQKRMVQQYTAWVV